MSRSTRQFVCAGCGYDLTGIPIVHHELCCPECGDHRVHIERWFEPKADWKRAWLYLPGAVLVGTLPVFVGWLILLSTTRQTWWIAAASPPYLYLGVVLWLWRPCPGAGITVLGLTAVVAGLLGVLVALALLFMTPPFSLLVVLPMGILYYALPVPLGMLWARDVLTDF